MKLSEPDAELYFELMWFLQFFVKQKLGLLPEVPTVAVYRSLPAEEKIEVREALYGNPGLIDEYVQSNPDRLSEEDLTIVSKWKYFVKGKFYIERYLKKYTVFIGKDTVYGVLGLHEALEEMIHRSYLPMYVRAVLLPFKGRVIYDGFMQSYSLFFGRNIKANLKEQYLRAKQRGEIVTSFEGKGKGKVSEQRAVASQDWQADIEELVKRARKLRGGSGQPAMHSPAFSLVKASLNLALIGVTDPENADRLFEELQKVSRALKRVEATIYRM
jgi:hypothetical protein